MMKKVIQAQSDNLEDIGNMIKRLRVDKELSINQLANRSGTSKVFISHLERGIGKGIQLSKLNSLFEALGFTLLLIPSKKRAA